MTEKSAPKYRVHPWKLFLRFLAVSSTTPGGGYSIIAVLEREMIRLGWMNEEEFAGIFALIQAVPGTAAFNLAVISGKRLAGTPGAILAGLGTLLPPVFLVILANSLFALLPREPWLEGAIMGSYAVALGFVASISWKVFYQYRKQPLWLLICLGATVLMVFIPQFFLLWFGLIIILFYRLDTWKK